MKARRFMGFLPTTTVRPPANQAAGRAVGLPHTQPRLARSVRHVLAADRIILNRGLRRAVAFTKPVLTENWDTT
jgi:hypothetical protein